MDFYDEEYEKKYKPSYDYVAEHSKVLFDFALIIVVIALTIELVKLAFKL